MAATCRTCSNRDGVVAVAVVVVVAIGVGVAAAAALDKTVDVVVDLVVCESAAGLRAAFRVETRSLGVDLRGNGSPSTSIQSAAPAPAPCVLLTWWLDGAGGGCVRACADEAAGPSARVSTKVLVPKAWILAWVRAASLSSASFFASSTCLALKLCLLVVCSTPFPPSPPPPLFSSSFSSSLFLLPMW